MYNITRVISYFNPFLVFIIAFLIVNIISYLIIPKKYRYIVLLVTGLVAYICLSKLVSIFLFITIGLTYITGLLLNKVKCDNVTKGLKRPERKLVKKKIKRLNKRIIILYLLLNLGILITLKYMNFFSVYTTMFLNLFRQSKNPNVFNFLIPLGISYYTLTSISYVIDVARGKFTAEKNILKLSLFISYYPSIYMGPFNRYDELGSTIFKNDNLNTKTFFDGLALILFGIFKILLVAGRAAMFSDYIFKNYKSYSGLVIILGAMMFSIQLFAEFSGFIDVSRGVSRILNIELPSNFKKPFLSKTVSEFWTRWHMSLGRFFKDYVFYPVSLSKPLSRITKKMPNWLSDFITVSVSLLFVWVLMGLWHGTSIKYLIYGLYFFVCMIIYNVFNPIINKLFIKIHLTEDSMAKNILSIILTNIIIGIGLMMFRASNISIFINMFKSIFSLENNYINIRNFIDMKDFIIMIFSIILMLLPLFFQLFKIDLKERFNLLSSNKKYVLCVMAIFLIITFGVYGLGYIPPDPIYGGF